VDHGQFNRSIGLLETIFLDDTRRRLHGGRGEGGRDLQDTVDDFFGLPPPFTPERDCNAVFGTLTAKEVGMLADTYLFALFQPGSLNEGLADILRRSLFSQAAYDVTLAKVCMSCSEARKFISFDEANNDQHKYGFANYCGDGMFGADMVVRLHFFHRLAARPVTEYQWLCTRLHESLPSNPFTFYSFFLTVSNKVHS
jgi:hypothetical protein